MQLLRLLVLGASTDTLIDPRQDEVTGEAFALIAVIQEVLSHGCGQGTHNGGLLGVA